MDLLMELYKHEYEAQIREWEMEEYLERHEKNLERQKTKAKKKFNASN